MDLRDKVIAGTVALATAATPTLAHAYNPVYSGNTTNPTYSARTIDSVAGLEQGQNGIKLMSPSTGEYLPVSAGGRPDVKRIRDYLATHDSLVIQGNPGKEYMANLVEALNQDSQTNNGEGLSTGQKWAIGIIAGVVGGGFVVYRIRQNGNKKVIEGGT